MLSLNGYLFLNRRILHEIYTRCFLSLFLTGCFAEQDYTGFYKNEDGNTQILKLEKINNDSVYLMKELNFGGAPFKVKIKDKTITEIDANTQIGSVKGSDILIRDYDKKGPCIQWGDYGVN